MIEANLYFGECVCPIKKNQWSLGHRRNKSLGHKSLGLKSLGH